MAFELHFRCNDTECFLCNHLQSIVGSLSLRVISRTSDVLSHADVRPSSEASMASICHNRKARARVYNKVYYCSRKEACYEDADACHSQPVHPCNTLLQHCLSGLYEGHRYWADGSCCSDNSQQSVRCVFLWLQARVCSLA